MSSTKRRYTAGRFASERYAAGKWRGTGTNGTAEEITQARTFSPLTGMRYGTFDKSVTSVGPDFLHGSLDMWLYLPGDITICQSLTGDVNVKPHLSGRVEVNR